MAVGICGAVISAVHRLECERYITDTAAQISDLCDSLTSLEKREIFPPNEDTALSKLQSKVTKLAEVLQQRNEAAQRGQENMKSLISDISHQLKTPIANLKMYTAFGGRKHLRGTAHAVHRGHSHFGGQADIFI